MAILTILAILIIPDGAAAENLQQREEAIDVARTFLQEGEMRVAAIEHRPQPLISAGLLDGRAVTCDPGIREGTLLVGRGPENTRAFGRQLTRMMAVVPI